MGRAENPGAIGRGHVFRPRTGTAKVSALLCAVLLAVTIVTGSRSMLVYAALPFMFFVQCFQQLRIDGNRAQRTGLRAVDFDLSTARVKTTGRSWWMQLFFLGHCLELRDADGKGLLLEAWLWSPETRQAVLEAVAAANPGAETAHS
jgi:hypothetical protein